jgi:hypothetical protein
MVHSVAPLANGPYKCGFVVILFKVDDHVVKYQTTPNPMQSDLKVPLVLNWVPKFFERLEVLKKRNLNCGENTDGETNAVSPECEI